MLMTRSACHDTNMESERSNTDMEEHTGKCLYSVKAAVWLASWEATKKRRGLLARGFSADVTVNPGAQDQWKHAIDVLREGDHYIVLMLDQALGGRLKRWWQFWR